MHRGLSRRSFIGTGIKSAFALAAYSQLTADAAPALLTSDVPRASRAQATALQPAFARLDDFITQHMRETGAPGMTLALANRDGVLRVSTYGLADVKSGARVAPETLFQIGSISKSFVAIALLQLRDEGKLDLHKPVAQYLPWLKIVSKFEPVTAHDILSHTAGLPAAPLLLDTLLAEIPTGYKPGAHFLYSNTGYNILGFLIEALDGRPFAAAMRARLLTPLGMTASAPVISNETRSRMAVGYRPFYEDRPFPLRGRLGEAPWIEMDMAAGSITATPADMAAYMTALINRGATPRGARILSEESFRLMTSPVINAPFRGEPASYGYGLWISDINGHTRLRHTGGMVAFSSSIDIDLNEGLGAFASVNANLQGYRPVAVTKFALETLTASLGGKPLPTTPAPQASPEEVKNAADYAGTLTSPDGKRITLAVEGDRLLLVHKGQRVALERAGRDLFIVKHADFDLFRLGFVRENNHVVEAFHGADWYAGEGYAGARTFTYPKEWEAYAGHYFNDSPWYGTARIVLRKGQLLLDGVQPLAPAEGGTFRLAGDEFSPDRISFESVVGGKAMRVNYSGIIFRRVFTP
ncbi:MAG: hypothetical protein QOF61_2960 [Acidobacteriota bacterium]|jgi:CubicO group peptidase (beta-lactamase class C family)|nr:hypothetical protein [Acidobacteriota bacterium]